MKPSKLTEVAKISNFHSGLLKSNPLSIYLHRTVFRCRKIFFSHQRFFCDHCWFRNIICWKLFLTFSGHIYAGFSNISTTWQCHSFLFYLPLTLVSGRYVNLFAHQVLKFKWKFWIFQTSLNVIAGPESEIEVNQSEQLITNYF